MTLDSSTAIAFVLVLARTTAWTMVLPIFRGVSAVGRLALALGLAMFIAPLVDSRPLPADLSGFIVAALTETVVGLTIGWIVSLVLSAAAAAGSLIDLFSGFSASIVLDPISGHQNAIFSRLNNLVLALLVAVSPALHGLIRGFVASYERVPIGIAPDYNESAPAVIASAVGGTLVSAVLIAAPVFAALLLVEAALAVSSRFVPQANVFYLGLPIKAFITIAVTGAMMIVLQQRIPFLFTVADELQRQVIG